MNLSDDRPEPTSGIASGESPEPVPELSEAVNSMDEYYQLKQELQIITVAISIFVFGCVWFFYSLNTALNYLLGACTSVVYLRMLARNVEQLGPQKRQIGRSQLAVLIGLMIIATQWSQLRVLPIFLGFLTYKATLLIVMLRSVFAHTRPSYRASKTP
ncbi:ATP synthase subunit I [Leptolyngbya sp. 'hensonii']|nr:ATP synthase subunit I [Leptolyngbya sp. 'hensonii']